MVHLAASRPLVTRVQQHLTVLLAPLVALLLLAAFAGVQPVGADDQNPANVPVVALPGYHVALFAKGAAKTTNPDSITVDAAHIYVGYQNATKADGSDGGSSTIIEYTDDGKEIRSFSITGRCDGLRFDPATHLLWATVNEDANSSLYTINPEKENGAITHYQFSGAPHGGGYDDLAFVHGMTFIVASNPTPNGAGVNDHPAVDTVVLKDNTTGLPPGFAGTAMLTPVLFGNAVVTDAMTKKPVTLNLLDPDSLTIDPQGDVVLIDQADAELITIHNAGAAGQSATRLTVGTQIDDTVWAKRAEGRLFVVDATQNAIYVIRSEFKPGTVYTEAPNDSGVASFVGTVNLTTGTITPVAIGFVKPTGLLFVPDGERGGDQ